MIKIIFYAVLIAVFASIPAAAQDPAAILEGMGQAYAKVNDYTAILNKRELLKGKVIEEKIRIKFKKPFKVYMKWLEGKHEGRQALYVQGENGGKIAGREGGFWGFLKGNYDPNGKLAMRGNRHPITDLGLGKLIETVDKDVRRGKERRELKLAIQGEEEVYGRKAWHIIKETPAEGYYSPKMEIWLDKELNLPIKIVIYGPGNEFLESYGYENLKINPGLNDDEFARGYKEYGF